MPDTIEEAIEQAALEGIQSVTVAGQTVAATPLKDLIEADKHQKANTQAQSSSRLIFNKISPPGAA